MSTPGTLASFTVYKGTVFGPIQLTAKNDGAIVDLSGWSVAAKAHRKSDGLEVNLSPSITSAAAGVIQLMDFSATTTGNLQEGSYEWDLVLTTAGGKKLPPSIEGTFAVADSDSA